MKTILYLATALCVMGLAFWAYHVNYATQDQQSEMRRMKNEIASLQEGLGVLRAEWAYLNRPDRLRELVNLNFASLGLLPLAPEQFGSAAQVAYPAPPMPDEPLVGGLDVPVHTGRAKTIAVSHEVVEDLP
ncbi:cell division protein FtsL [Sinirhodobacter populi]|uniref:Cell division protein FtsL n=1 Tax=Paenirhodobacter populi TaxID=2306993 RepID=A0A443KFQ0_9RHOB|nr:cell division protein FtsL [Sinirhodobacter populi]RWR31578.1 cell division protein FtsL [Sinirhodobacter populi]